MAKTARVDFATFRRVIRGVMPLVASVILASCNRGPSTLAIGTSAPAFALPGIDGQSHSLADFASSPVLAVAFTCNHCPAAELYEQRLQQLYLDYRSRGVALVAINPDSPKTIALKDLAYSDVPDSLNGMVERARHRHLEYPYLYDGEAQAAATAYQVIATPQIYIFDADRHLQYVGRIDDNLDESRVTARYARAAIDALLARQPVSVQTTAASGCPVRRLGQVSVVEEEQKAIEAAPIALKVAGPPELKTLRGNGTSKLSLVNFWATWCGPCIVEFPDLQTTYRMYQSRNLELVTVSIDVPDGRPNVMKVLQNRHASSANYIFATDDTVGLQEAFDPALPASVPFTMLIAPNGDVLHQEHGEAQTLQLRRAILANLPDDPQYPGLQKYWTN